MDLGVPWRMTGGDGVRILLGDVLRGMDMFDDLDFPENFVVHNSDDFRSGEDFAVDTAGILDCNV